MVKGVGLHAEIFFVKNSIGPKSQKSLASKFCFFDEEVDIVIKASQENELMFIHGLHTGLRVVQLVQLHCCLDRQNYILPPHLIY